MSDHISDADLLPNRSEALEHLAGGLRELGLRVRALELEPSPNRVAAWVNRICVEERFVVRARFDRDDAGRDRWKFVLVEDESTVLGRSDNLPGAVDEIVTFVKESG